MKIRSIAVLVVTGAMASTLAAACGEAKSVDEPSAPADENVDSSAQAIRGGHTRDIDISVLGTPDLECGGEVCFFVGADKNITHIWVKAEGCSPDDYEVEIDGHAAGPASAGPPDCDGFGGVRYVTGGRNPTAQYFDTNTVCVRFVSGIDPGLVAVQAKASATCEDLSVGTGQCSPCEGPGEGGGRPCTCPGDTTSSTSGGWGWGD